MPEIMGQSSREFDPGHNVETTAMKKEELLKTIYHLRRSHYLSRHNKISVKKLFKFSLQLHSFIT